MSETTTDAPERAFGPEDLVRLRDDEQLSWAQMAAKLGLGSPGAARRTYSALVRPHTESVLTRRAAPAARVQPVDLTTMDAGQVAELLTGRTIVVERRTGTEDIPVVRVTSQKDGTINFNDGTKSRAVKAAAVLALK